MSRSAAAVALARSGDESVLVDLLIALESSNDVTRSGVLLGLGILGTPDVRSVLTSVLADDRTGRRALGDAAREISRAHRAMAALALGLLPAVAKGDLLRDVVLSTDDYDPEIHWAACIGLGLRENRPSNVGQNRLARGLGAALDDQALVGRDVARYLAVLERVDVEARSRGALLVSLARLRPADERVRAAVIRAASDSEATFARAAIVAAAALVPDASVNEVLRNAVGGADAGIAGIATLALGRHADDLTFDELLAAMDGRLSLRPFAIYAAFEASEGRPDRETRLAEFLTARLAAAATPVEDLAAMALIAGLLGAEGAAEPLARLAAEPAESLGRAAARLGLTLAGRLPERDAWRLEQNLFGRDARIVHDAALTLALGAREGAAAELCEALANAPDAFSSAGIARALGLLRDLPACRRLCALIGDPTTRPEARAFALGSLGLVFANPAEDRLQRLRDVMATPLASPSLGLAFHLL